MIIRLRILGRCGVSPRRAWRFIWSSSRRARRA